MDSYDDVRSPELFSSRSMAVLIHLALTGWFAFTIWRTMGFGGARDDSHHSNSCSFVMFKTVSVLGLPQ